MSIISLANQALDRFTFPVEQKVSVIQEHIATEPQRSAIISKYFNLPHEKKVDFISQYGEDLWVYICVNRIAQSAARVPLKVFRRRSNKGIKGLPKKDYDVIVKSGIKLPPYSLSLECFFSIQELSKMPTDLLYKLDVIDEAPDSPLQMLLDKPTPFFTKYYLIEGSTTYLELRGNSFIELVTENTKMPPSEMNPPVEMWHLDPDKIAIVPDKKEFIQAYVYAADRLKIPINPANMIHIKYFNPENVFYGQGTVQALVKTIKQEKNLTEFQNNFYRQGMKPSAVLSTDEPLGDHQFDRMQAQIETSYSGLANMHRPLLLEGGLKWTAMSLTQQDAQLLEFKKLDREEYLAAFGLPPIMVGLPTENFATAQESRRAYYLDTLMPKLQTHEEKFNNELAPLFGPDFFVKFDFSNTPAMEVNREEFQKSLEAALANGSLTRREYRENLSRLGIELSDIELGEEGDEFFISSNLIPLDALGDSQDELEEPEDDKPKPKPKPDDDDEDEEEERQFLYGDD